MRHFSFIAVVGFLSIFNGPLALAADPVMYRSRPEPMKASPDDFASGWYLRGDIQAVRPNDPFLEADGTLSGTQTERRNTWGGGVGAGYQWNSWFRTDATLEGTQTQTNSRSTTTTPHQVSGAPNTIVCPYQLTGLQTSDSTPILLGYLYDTTNTCRNDASATEQRVTALINGYIDLGTYAGVTPYLGAGVGFTRMTLNGSSQYFKTSDGSAFSADLTPTGGYPLVWLNQAAAQIPYTPRVGSDSTKAALTFGPQNWNTVSRQTYYRPAWSLTGGVAYDLGSNFKLDLSYRYTNLGSYTVVQADGSTTQKSVTQQAVRIGLRYAL